MKRTGPSSKRDVTSRNLKHLTTVEHHRVGYNVYFTPPLAVPRTGTSRDGTATEEPVGKNGKHASTRGIALFVAAASKREQCDGPVR